jgi:hypothetical protein
MSQEMLKSATHRARRYSAVSLAVLGLAVGSSAVEGVSAAADPAHTAVPAIAHKACAHIPKERIIFGHDDYAVKVGKLCLDFYPNGRVKSRTETRCTTWVAERGEATYLRSQETEAQEFFNRKGQQVGGASSISEVNNCPGVSVVVGPPPLPPGYER